MLINLNDLPDVIARAITDQLTADDLSPAGVLDAARDINDTAGWALDADADGELLDEPVTVILTDEQLRAAVTLALQWQADAVDNLDLRCLADFDEGGDDDA